MTEKTTLTDGSPVTDDHREIISGGLRHGQQKAYVILSAEERAKGFVRPVRKSYRHVGAPSPKHPLRDLTDDEKEKYGVDWAKFEDYPLEVERKPNAAMHGRFWSQKEIDKIGKGCRTVTTMGQSLAETYARDQKFYSGTFCCECSTHFPVKEFVWEGTDERVGS